VSLIKHKNSHINNTFLQNYSLLNQLTTINNTYKQITTVKMYLSYLPLFYRLFTAFIIIIIIIIIIIYTDPTSPGWVVYKFQQQQQQQQQLSCSSTEVKARRPRLVLGSVYSWPPGKTGHCRPGSVGRCGRWTVYVLVIEWRTLNEYSIRWLRAVVALTLNYLYLNLHISLLFTPFAIGCIRC